MVGLCNKEMLFECEYRLTCSSPDGVGYARASTYYSIQQTPGQLLLEFLFPLSGHRPPVENTPTMFHSCRARTPQLLALLSLAHSPNAHTPHHPLIRLSSRPRTRTWVRPSCKALAQTCDQLTYLQRSNPSRHCIRKSSSEMSATGNWTLR